MGQIVKIVYFSKKGSPIENNGTTTNVQLLMVMEKLNFFKNFKKLSNKFFLKKKFQN